MGSAQTLLSCDANERSKALHDAAHGFRLGAGLFGDRGALLRAGRNLLRDGLHLVECRSQLLDALRLLFAAGIHLAGQQARLFGLSCHPLDAWVTSRSRRLPSRELAIDS